MPLLMDHIVLNVEDVETMMRFYTNVMGFTAERLTEYRAGKVPFPSVRINADTIIDLFPRALWGPGDNNSTGHTNLNHFCIAIDKDGWDRLSQRLTVKGLPVELGPVKRWGAHGTGISIYFRDPEKNLIEARYYVNNEETQPCFLST